MNKQIFRAVGFDLQSSPQNVIDLVRGPDVNVVDIGEVDTVFVGIADDGRDGDRKLMRISAGSNKPIVPTIAVLRNDNSGGVDDLVAWLTWDEARALADALTKAANLAEFG